MTDEDLASIEDVPGIYYFARSFGDNFKPFYFGETLSLRSRLKNHLESRRIVDILRGMKVAGAPEISNGPRSFHFAYFKGKRKQDPKTCLRIAQKFMIREALTNNISLLNSQLTVIRTHNIIFEGDDVRGSIFQKKNSIER